jgi:hypothetical protein
MQLVISVITGCLCRLTMVYKFYVEGVRWLKRINMKFILIHFFLGNICNIIHNDYSGNSAIIFSEDKYTIKYK